MSRATLALILIAARCAWCGDHDFGPVAPQPLPALTATRHDGARVQLREVFHGHSTAVQFVFTQCRTACPLLGGLFAKVDRDPSQIRLVSISVDPANDTPERLQAWLRTYRASPRWTALRVAEKDLKPLLDAFGLKAGAPAAHSMQAFLVDDQERFVNRTTAMPSAAEVLRMTGLARAGNEPVDSSFARCANCHGDDFRGGREGSTVAPPLTRRALLSALSRRGGPPSAYTEESFCIALRSGVDPAGVVFSNLMPRFDLDPASCSALWQRATNLEALIRR